MRETIRRRLAQLSGPCLQLLALAAVIGREFNLDLLALVSKESLRVERAPLLTLLHEALVASVISEVPNETGRYRFMHALMRETLYEDVPLTERTRLHRQIGEAMEALSAGYLRPHLSVLADHFFKAAPSGSADKAIHYAIQAGERATVLLAYEEAASHYTRALQTLELIEGNEARRCELLLALGEAQSHAGETQQARETFLQAAAIARKLQTRGESPQAAAFLARAALGFGKIWFVTGTGTIDEPLVRLLENARTALGETDSTLRARVLARLAAELRWSAPRA